MIETQLNNLRRLIAAGATASDIRDTLNLTTPQYEKYLKRLADQDRRILEQDEKARDSMYVELTALKDRLLGTIRRCTTITNTMDIPPSVRLEAEKIICEASLAVAKLSFEGPAIIREMPKDIKRIAAGKTQALPDIKLADDGVEKERASLVEEKVEDSGQEAEDSAG